MPKWGEDYALSFGSAITEGLFRAIVVTARCLGIRFIDPRSVALLLAFRLIALSKKTGIRPIGVGEVGRIIIERQSCQSPEGIFRML